MQRKFTRNVYRTVGDIVYVALQGRSRIVVAECIIDVNDLDAVINFARWHYHPTKRNGSQAYAAAHKDGKGIFLHRFLMSPALDEVIDHINGNTLDCRRQNMWRCTPADNAANRRHHINVASFPPPVSHTLEHAVSVYKQLYNITDNSLDAEITLLRQAR